MADDEALACHRDNFRRDGWQLVDVNQLLDLSKQALDQEEVAAGDTSDRVEHISVGAVVHLQSKTKLDRVPLVAFGAVWMWAVDAALFLVTTGPGAAVLHAVADILGVIGSLPVVGAGLSAFLTGLVGVLVWAVGAAVASLVGLIPFEIFRALWEANDATERNSLLSWSGLGWAQVDRTYRGKRHTVFRLGSGPAVILLHEIFGVSPELEELARIIAHRGYTVYLPWLFGGVCRPHTFRDALRIACKTRIQIRVDRQIDRVTKSGMVAHDAVARQAVVRSTGAPRVPVAGRCQCFKSQVLPQARAAGVPGIGQHETSCFMQGAEARFLFIPFLGPRVSLLATMLSVRSSDLSAGAACR